MPKRFFIAKDIDVIEFKSVTEWGYPRHNHNFFELTYIVEGQGQHILNDSIIEYKKGDLFYLTPKDEHEFVVAKPTTFGIIKFTEQLFLEKTTFSVSNYWKQNLEMVTSHSNIIAESIIHYKHDQNQLFRLYDLIKDELNNSLICNRHVLSALFGALLIILSRNLTASKDNPHNEVSDSKKIDNILTYIRQNILNKDQIRIKAIADEFFMSPNYVSMFIKKHAGISIQQYVIQTRINIAKRLLKETNLSINEIAYKTGFVDSSHFNRIFKKYSGVNPSGYNA